MVKEMGLFKIGTEKINVMKKWRNILSSEVSVVMAAHYNHQTIS
jgi:hypothetical protein